MTERAKETLKAVSETVFPGIIQSLSGPGSSPKNNSYAAFSQRTSKDPELKLGNEIVSHLHLQMCLFFNLCYFPFWLAVTIVATVIKYNLLNYLYQFILLTVLVAVVLIELARLYLGYLGNLTEKVSMMSHDDILHRLCL